MSAAFVLGGGGRWGAVELHLLPSGLTLAPDDGPERNWSDFTDSDELIGGARAATTDDLASVS